MTKVEILTKYLVLLLELDHPSGAESLKAELAALKKRPERQRPLQISFDHEHGTWSIHQEYIDAWTKAYPAVNVEREIAAAGAWLMANPKKAPRSNYARFLNGWLSRTQDRGGTRGLVASNRPAGEDRAEAWAKSSQ